MLRIIDMAKMRTGLTNSNPETNTHFICVNWHYGETSHLKVSDFKTARHEGLRRYWAVNV